MSKKDVFKTLSQVIGTPEDNSIWMVREVIKDMALSCTMCGKDYQSVEAQDRLGLAIVPDQFGPEKLRVSVGCACGHLGEISLRPNPLIVA